MECEPCREALSAWLDGEDAPTPSVLVDDHLAGCAAGRAYERRLADLHRMSRVRQAEPVPDLSGATMARVAPRANPRDPVLGWLRSGLTFVGILSVALSGPLLLANSVLLGASMTAASLIEISDDHSAAHGLVIHAAELGGVLLLALFARHGTSPSRTNRLPAT
jgi:predicted anti-sigma-YlaC factor YlaD